MPYEHRKNAFPLPTNISGHALRSVCFDIPDVAEYRQAFWGHLWELGNWYMWQKLTTADDRDQEAAAYWREILHINYQRWNDFEECAADTCREYPPSAGFIEWFPNNPYLSPDFVGDGYNNPAWYLATTASNIAYGSAFGDAITSIDRFPPGSLPSVIPASGLPRFRINVTGAGTVKATLVNLFGGSLIQTTTDDDVLTLKFVDVSRDTVSAPPETQTELTVEFTFTTPGAHHIDFIVISWVNSSIPFLHHGGGLRRVELCGFETMPVTTPPFRFTEACGLEYYNGEEWIPVDGWTEFAPACFTGADGVDGVDGVDGSDAPATVVRSNPAGFGNMQQNIAEAGFTDIANSDYVRRDGLYPMTGGLEIDPPSDQTAILMRFATQPASNPFQYLVNTVGRSFITPQGSFLSSISGNTATLGASGSPIVNLARGGVNSGLQSNAAGLLDVLIATQTLHRFYSNGRMTMGVMATNPLTQLALLVNDAAYAGLEIKGHASQTLPLLQVKDSAGVIIDQIAANGSAEFGVNSAETASFPDALSLYHESSATPAAQFGSTLRFQGKSTTTAKRNMATYRAVWNEPTDATRKATVVQSVYDTSIREYLRASTDGTQPTIGFLGANDAVRTDVGVIDCQGSVGLKAALDELKRADEISLKHPEQTSAHYEVIRLSHQLGDDAPAWFEALLDARDKLQAVADAARECADMLAFGLNERTFGHAAERAVMVRERLREVLRKLDGEGEGQKGKRQLPQCGTDCRQSIYF